MRTCILIAFICFLFNLHSKASAFSWAHTPSPQLDTAVGSNVTLRWDFEESINESFIFLLVTRFHGQNLANDTILAQRVGNQTIVLPEYEGRVFLKEKATLVLYNVTWSDEMTYCCNVYCTDVAESDCIELTVQEPPVITNPMKQLTLIENETLSLYCNATGRPEPLVLWQKVNATNQVHANPLHIAQVKRNSSGSYECVAVNGAGTAFAITHVDVQYPTSVSVFPKNVTLNESDEAHINCNATGNPTPWFSWFKRDNRNDVLSSSDRLIWRVKGKEDEGDYVCSAWNGVGPPASQSAKLTVQNHRPFATAFSSCHPDNTFWKDDMAALKCSSSANPSPTYSLYHNGKLIRKNRSGYYKICRVQSRHAGIYTCVAQNEFGSGKAHSIEIMVYAPASSAVFPRHLNVTEGQTAFFNCNTSGSPEPTVTWRKLQTSQVFSRTKALTINSTSRHDTGYYECATFNGVGSEGKDLAFLNVFHAPQIHYSGSVPGAVNEGGYVNLSCQASGNPVPVISWFDVKSNKEVNVTGEDFPSFQAERDESGRYECRARNQLGNDSARINFTVFFKPSVQAKTVVYSWMHHKTKISCTAHGFPRPVVTWSRNGTVVQSNVSDKDVRSTLVMIPEDSSDFGTFTCFAQNQLGLSLVNITVRGIETPEPPVIRNIEAGSNFINISWAPPDLPEGYPPLNILVQVRRQDDPLGWVNCTDMSVDGSYCVFHEAQSNTTYVVRLFARNAAGLTSNSLIGETRTRVAEPTPSPGNNEGKKFNARPFILAGIICGAGLILVVALSVVLFVRHKRHTGGGDLQ